MSEIYSFIKSGITPGSNLTAKVFLLPLIYAGLTLVCVPHAYGTYLPFSYINCMSMQASGVVCSKRLLNQAVGKSLRTHNPKSKKGAQVMRKNEKITALYERLSRDDFGKDDDQQRESNSISNQKAMLEEFTARQGFTNIVHFTDDGISGTCFDRPGFLAMMKEVELFTSFMVQFEYEK